VSATNLVSGIVRDARGGTVAGARVIMEDGPGPFPDVAALTGGDGSFVISVPAQGRYRLACAADGFVTARVEAVVGDESPSQVTFELETE
jgi:hypothetical protein